MNQVIEQMMQELTSKEVLYPAFLELRDRLPGWLEENGPAEDPKKVQNYKAQLAIARKIVETFEQPDYEHRKREYQQVVFEQMQLMQECGSPPEGLLSEESEQTTTGMGEDNADKEGSNSSIPPNCPQM